jgi:hypothetical protein
MPAGKSRPSLRPLFIYGFTSTSVLVERSLDDDLLTIDSALPSGARCESQGRESAARAQAARGRVCRGQSAAPMAEGQAGAGRRLSRRRVLDGAFAASLRAAPAVANPSRLQVASRFWPWRSGRYPPGDSWSALVQRFRDRMLARRDGRGLRSSFEWRAGSRNHGVEDRRRAGPRTCEIDRAP